MPLKRWLTTVALTLALLAPSLAKPKPAEAVYLLDYGDSVSIHVKDFAQFDYAGAVRPDGLVSIPYVGDVEVAGLTTSQVVTRLTTLLRRQLRDPIVTVSITTMRPRYVMVLGEVGHPGRVEMNQPHLTVLDAIAASGGFTQRAVKNQVVLLHGDGAQARHYVIDVDKMLRTADLTDNLELSPDDRIQVPETWWPNVENWVQTITPVVTLITSLAVLIGLYVQASNYQSGR